MTLTYQAHDLAVLVFRIVQWRVGGMARILQIIIDEEFIAE